MIKKFFKIFLIELEELQQNLETLTGVYAQRLNDGQITNYVSKENISVLRAEIFGIVHITEAVENIDYSRCRNVEELIAEILKTAESEIVKRQLPAADLVLVKSKLEKVRLYILTTGTA